MYDLVDHRQHFRQRGSHGRATWRDTVFASQPYPEPDNAVLSEKALEEARCAAHEHGVGVWVSAQYSCWYTGRTTLVLIGRGLRPENAARFGFTAVAAAPESVQ